MDDGTEFENDSLTMAAGNTHLQSSQPVVETISGVVALDWWEVGACVQWNCDPTIPPQKSFSELKEMKEICQGSRRAQFLSVGTNHWQLLGKGRGGGKGAYFPYQLTCEGITVACGSEGGKSRLFPNFTYTVSGEACLMIGVPESEQRVTELLKFLGGKFTDRWCRRIDICLDTLYPNLCEDLSKLCTAGCSIGSIRTKSIFLQPSGLNGVAVGQGSAVQIRIYDKLKELHLKSESYQMEMIAKRWGGELPKSATRIEYQIRRAFLAQYGIKSADEVLKRLPDIVSRITQFESHPTFAVTTEPPDRENNHQSRASINPHWAGVVRRFQEGIGKSLNPLKRVEGGMLNNQKACKMIMGFATSSAANSGAMIESFDDAIEWIRHLCLVNGIDDNQWKGKWELKAKTKNLPLNSHRYQSNWEVDREDVDGPRQ